MRIAIFVKAPQVWGAETSLLTLLSTAAAREHEITVFLPSSSPLVPILVDRGIDWRHHEFSAFNSLSKGGLSDGSLIDLVSDGISLMRAAWSTRPRVMGFDVILTFGLWETPEIALAGRLARVPVVWDFHVTFSGKRARPAMKVLRKMVSAIISPSEAAFLLAGVTRKLSNEHVVRRPVTPPLVEAPKRVPNVVPVVGIFGQIDDRKSVLELLGALVDHQEAVKVNVVGAQEPEQATEYERQVRDFLTQKSPAWELIPRTTKVAEEMSKCDYIVNLSKHEAFGRTVVEAILSGTHPVVLAGDGPEEIVNMTGIGTVISSLEALPGVLLNDSPRGRAFVTEDERKRTADMFAPEKVAKDYFRHLRLHSRTPRETIGKRSTGKRRQMKIGETSSAINVAIIGTRGYPSYYGGFETAVRRLAPYLVDAGWDVTVYGRPGATKPNDAGRDSRVRSVVTAGAETTSLSTLSFGLTSVLHALREKPDVALVMNVANGFWLPLLRLRGIPTVVNVDGIEWERAKWGRLAKTVFRLGARMTASWANELIADAHAISARWKEDFGRDSRFIPYGGDVPASLPLVDGLAHRGYILMVARFVPENTVAEFLDAATALAAKYKVVIVGSSGYGGDFDERAAMLAADHENIQWLGHLSDDQKLHSLWQHAGAYFHGHSVGGTNPALVQAMACGAPVVARDTVYNREVLADTATYVSPDAAEIQTALAQAMEAANDFDPAGVVHRAAEHYSWDGVCAKYEEALTAQIKRNRNPIQTGLVG